MSSASQPTLTVRMFQPGDALAFRTINEAWITRHFTLEAKDIDTLGHPEAAILDKGGQIFFATLNDQPVGCCALLPLGEGAYEVGKMGVLDAARGQGAGRRVLEVAIDWARRHGATRLYLETNRILAPAIQLYLSVGFRELPPERVTPSPYARANVYMELWLTEPSYPALSAENRR